MLETIIKMWSKYGYVYLNGLAGTLCLAAITVFCGTLLGTVLAVMRLSKVKPFQWVVRFYVWVLRGTPILLQLYFFWIFLPKIVHVRISDTFCIVIALIVNASSYVAEVIRAGIQAVDKGQMEAARSLGMTGRHAMTKIILPQAVKNILPALGNEFIVLLKETSISGYIGIRDLTHGGDIIRSNTYDAFLPLIAVAIIYLIIVVGLSSLVSRLEQKLKTDGR